MLISFAVTANVICVFVFAYAKSRFSHDTAHIFSETLLFSDRNFIKNDIKMEKLLLILIKKTKWTHLDDENGNVLSSHIG